MTVSCMGATAMRRDDLIRTAFGRLAFNYHTVQDRFEEGAWKGRPGFLIGGGPSAAEVPFQRLSGERVVAVNRAHECGVADVVVTGELRWLRNFSRVEEINRRIPLVYAYCADVKKNRRMRINRNVYVIPCVDADGPLWGTSFEEGVARGCSGIRALNFLALLGASPIYLIGFDFTFSWSQSHWHAGYPLPPEEDDLKVFQRVWERVAEQIPKDVQIFNLSMRSMLGVFPKVHWKSVIK